MTEPKEPTRPLPSRAVGTHSREGGLGFNRGGDPLGDQPRRKPTREEREQAARQRRALQSANQQLEARVSRGEMLQLFKGLERSMLQLSDRQEAMFLTLKRMDRERFDSLFADSVQRIRQWRLKIHHLTSGGLALREFDAEAQAWNADQDNPKIGAHCFDIDWLAEQVRSDTELARPEKIFFLQQFGFTDEGVVRVLGEEGEPPPAEAGALEPQTLID